MRASKQGTLAVLCLVILHWLAASNASAARFVAFYPPAPGESNVSTEGQPTEVSMLLPSQGSGQSAADGDSAAPENSLLVFDGPTMNAWQAYCAAWQQFHRQPDEAALRKRLAVANAPFAFALNPNRSALTARMPLAGLKRYDSAHFQIYTDVTTERLKQVVVELEQFYAIWTQIFFPLWNQAPGWIDNPDAPRLKAVPKHRVVLFADLARYQEALKSEGDVVAISTGFYSDLLRLSFFCDEGEQRSETLYHELTHQLLLEATSATGRFRPGERSGFWLVEGIAAYMESTNLHSNYATIGGWESPRLQFARHRVLGAGTELQLTELQHESRSVVQRREDLGAWYSHVAAYTHALIDSPQWGLAATLGALADLYQIRRGRNADAPTKTPVIQLEDYLQLNDKSLDRIASSQLRALCLTRTEVTEEAIHRLPVQSSLGWLDMGFLPIGNAALRRLLPSARPLAQLNLESTQIDDELDRWFTEASALTELDLSNTRAGDQIIEAIPASAPLETLWLTGSQVTDACIQPISQFSHLQQVDLQATKVTPAGIARLRGLRPDLTINPLEVRTQP